MVSRCNTLSRREVYAEDLKKYIDIDIFGACGRPAPKKGSPPINLDFRTELGKVGSCVKEHLGQANAKSIIGQKGFQSGEQWLKWRK